MITETAPSNRLLTPEQAAEMLQVSKRTMYEWLRNGDIPSERIGERLIRVRESDVLSPDARTYFEQGCSFANHPETVDRAEEFFQKAIALNPRYFLAYFNLGRMFYEWSHFQRALNPLRKAVQLNPCFPAYMNLGLNCNRGNMYKEGEEALRKALELEPTNATAHHELGCCLMMTSYYDKERMREAVEHFRKALQGRGKNDPLSITSSYELSAYFLGQILVLNLQDYSGALIFAKQIEEAFANTAKHIRFLVELNAK